MGLRQKFGEWRAFFIYKFTIMFICLSDPLQHVPYTIVTRTLQACQAYLTGLSRLSYRPVTRTLQTSTCSVSTADYDANYVRVRYLDAI